MTYIWINILDTQWWQVNKFKFVLFFVESGTSIARFDSKMKQVSFAKIRDEMCTSSNGVSWRQNVNKHKRYQKHLNPYKPCLLFVGHRQKVKIQIRLRRKRRLVRFSTACLQNDLSKFDENTKYHPTTWILVILVDGMERGSKWH